MEKEYFKIAQAALIAGKIMLESNAESYRVEDTARHILETSGLSDADVVTNTTGIFISLSDKNLNMDPITIIKRVDSRSNKLNRIYYVNNISRQLSAGTISIDQALEELRWIDRPEYSVMTKDLANIFLVVSFVIVLGGNLWDIIFSSFVGMIVAYARVLRKTFDLNSFIHGSTTTLITALCVQIIAGVIPLPLSTDILIIGGLIPLFPGTLVTNGIRDMLKGDYVSGIARIADATVTAFSLAVGVATGIYIYLGVSTWFI